MKTRLKAITTTLSIMALLWTGQSFASQQVSDIHAPKDLENIHVVKLATDAHSTDFVIFVKKKVPLHKHLKHSETLYVLEGAGEFELADKTISIAAGDHIRIPEGVPHAVTVTSDKPLKVISVQAPEFFGKDRVKVIR